MLQKGQTHGAVQVILVLTPSYYVTFEVQSGERLELKLDGRNYGQLAEHDFGILPFQGTRFKAFERQKRESYDE
ncbi:DUF2500 domain-containing protein [Lysinibacillus sphaericus]|uniref:DUF2500 domain-containing protein n=1 Tax=Lysinibacillus sphaericus TaxID=1421 RepID=UPI001E427079|nr:DUF2500 domain-containing protein [Lysinibacillus sphaericus]